MFAVVQMFTYETTLYIPNLIMMYSVIKYCLHYNSQGFSQDLIVNIEKSNRAPIL